MIALRPCTCDKFVPGRPFVPNRDCDKCWLFAHRPSVRRAWGGNPDDCDSLTIARPTMSAVELADLLEGPVLPMPERWQYWPVARAAHLILTDRFLARMPAYPEGRFSGRGIVICGGGSYEAGAYVACRMLRSVGWHHPIEVWHRGEAEPVSNRLRNLPGVSVVDAESHPARPQRRMLGGWESKIFAVINSRFEEVLFLDADCYPIYNPDVCFEPKHNPHGIVTWPDVPAGDHNANWATYGLAPDGNTSINGGHYVFTKRRSWDVLNLAAHYDDHSDYYYCDGIGGLGDQDQMRAAIHKLNAPMHRYGERPLSWDHQSYIQAGPLGRPMIIHRLCNKLALPGRFPFEPRWNPGNLPSESLAWSYFMEWLSAPSDRVCFPDEIPGWFTRAECELWYETCKDRTVLELGRYQGRSTVVAAASAKLVVSIDRDSDQEAEIWLQRYGVRHKVWLRTGLFHALAPTSGGPFDACLIDGCHDKPNVESDIAVAAPLLSPGAAVGFHDYGDPAHPDVKPTVDAAAKRLGWHFIAAADYLGIFSTPVS